jgi:hypothetical protein
MTDIPILYFETKIAKYSPIFVEIGPGVTDAKTNPQFQSVALTKSFATAGVKIKINNE